MNQQPKNMKTEDQIDFGVVSNRERDRDRDRERDRDGANSFADELEANPNVFDF